MFFHPKYVHEYRKTSLFKKFHDCGKMFRNLKIVVDSKKVHKLMRIMKFKENHDLKNFLSSEKCSQIKKIIHEQILKS